MARNKHVARKMRLNAMRKYARGMPLWAILKKFGLGGLHGWRRVFARRKWSWRRGARLKV